MADGKTFRWGILSTSGIARAQVIPAMLKSRNGFPAAIASRNVTKASRLASDFAIPAVFPDYAALIKDAKIDGLYIPLPNALHEDWALRAADRGIPVLCEKPLSTDAASARRIVDHFRRAGVPLMEAFMYRFHPVHERVRSLVAAGVIGELREVRAHLSTFRMERPDPVNNVVLSPELGGGVLLDAGCYPVNVCRWMFGTEPLRVRAWQDIDPRFGVDVTTAAMLEFADGRLGMVSTSHRAGGISSYTLTGTRGTIEVPRGFLPGWGEVLNEPLIIVTDPRTAARREETTAAPNQYVLMLEAFADAVRTGAPVPFSPEDAVANLAVTDAIVTSARSGGVADVIRH